jgi:hypothetical protein
VPILLIEQLSRHKLSGVRLLSGAAARPLSIYARAARMKCLRLRNSPDYQIEFQGN